MSDHYSVLGIAREASVYEIKKAHREQAKKHHPDNGGNEEAMKLVNIAWEILGDPARRNDYDLKLSNSAERSYTSQNTTPGSSYWHSSTTGSGTKTGTHYHNPKDRSSTRKKSQQKYESIARDTFRKICNCGCRGYPMTHLSWGIDYGRYSACPARKLRKKCGFYFNDAGTYVSWDPGKTSRWKKRNEARKNTSQTREVKRKADTARKAKEKEKREALLRNAEAVRVKNRMEPLSPAEARRRGLKYYRGKECKFGHNSLRDLNSNCLRCRELEKLKRASEKFSNLR